MRRLVIKDLEGDIKNRTARISVIGQGYIGLPTSLLMAKAGFQVLGFDINEELIRELSKGRTRLDREEGIQELISSLLGERYIPTNDERDLMGSDIVLIAVPTPKNANGPDLRMVISALETALRVIREGGLIIIESTLPPGTFERIIVPTVKKHGFSIGSNIYLAYCPERALPGRLINELVNNVRVIGAIDDRSAQLTKLLYKTFVRGEIELVDPLTAEVVKLVENSFRDVNIAFANEVARICEALGIDVRKVRELANKHPRVNLLVPGIGVGGSCLTKDPLFLYWASLENGYEPIILKRARELNANMPYHYTSILDDVVRNIKNGETGTIAVLGATYKGDVPDSRESPVEPFVRELLRKGHRVKVYDPLVTEAFGGEYVSNIFEAVRGADAIAFVTDHSEFRFLNLSKLRKAVKVEDPVVLFDGRMIFNPKEVEEAGFIYISVGMSLSTHKLPIKEFIAVR